MTRIVIFSSKTNKKYQEETSVSDFKTSNWADAVVTTERETIIKDGMALVLIPEGGLHSSRLGLHSINVLLYSVIEIISLPVKKTTSVRQMWCLSSTNKFTHTSSQTPKS